MKKTSLVFILFGVFLTNTYGALGTPQHEWLFEGPFGYYGVYAYDYRYAVILIADHKIETRVSYKTAKCMYITIPISGLLILLGMLTYTILNLRKNSNKTVQNKG